MSKITINNIKEEFGYEKNEEKNQIEENHKKITRYNKK